MESKVIISGGGYTAGLYPAAGGALVTLNKGDWEIFWPCHSAKEAMEAPTRHGLPCLFPPNRIDAGHFTFEGREYQFPMKPNQANNFSHGFLHVRPWQVVSQRENGVIMRYECTPQTDFYPYYPHRFRIDVQYEVSEAGLSQEVVITNRGERDMPVGLGWHTAFQLPWTAGSDGSRIRCRISLGKRICLNERMLPTGELRDLSPEEEAFRGEGQSPVYAAMDDHFTASPILLNGQPFHGAVLEDPESQSRVLYEVDAAYRHWMIFNARQAGNIICIEPQNWRINAPNLALPDEESGLDVLAPGQSKIYRSRIWAEKI